MNVYRRRRLLFTLSSLDVYTKWASLWWRLLGMFFRRLFSVHFIKHMCIAHIFVNSMLAHYRPTRTNKSLPDVDIAVVLIASFFFHT